MPARRNKWLVPVGLVPMGGLCLVTLLALWPSGGRAAQKASDAASATPQLSAEQLCGPISLHTAAAMLGVQIDRRQLLETCTPSANGASMAALARAAGKFDLDAKGYRMTWDKLLELDSPAILYIRPSHFVTVSPSQYASARQVGSIRVFDPAEAPKWWSRRTLEKSWSGETLVISRRAGSRRPAGPRISFGSLVHDVGDLRVPLNEKITVSLPCTNTGRQTLKISNVKTSCGCARAATSDEVLEPGRQGKIDVAMSLDEVRGPFLHTVAVETNDGLTPITEVVITGRTYNIQLTKQKELLLNALARKGRVSKSLLLQDPGDGSLKDSITAVSIPAPAGHDKPDVIRIEPAFGPFDPNRHHPLQAGPQDVVVDLDVVVPEGAPLGEFDRILRIATKVPGNDRIEISIRGVVVSSIVVSPAALFFPGREGTPVSRTVTLKNQAGQALDLEDIAVPSDLPVRVARQDGPDGTILLTVTCSPSSGVPNALTGDIRCRFADETVVIPVIVVGGPS